MTGQMCDGSSNRANLLLKLKNMDNEAIVTIMQNGKLGIRHSHVKYNFQYISEFYFDCTVLRAFTKN